MATSSRRLGGLLILFSILAQGAYSFAIFGYVPEYRFGTLDWTSAVRLTTHLVLFSVEPAEDGDLRGVENLKALNLPGSGFKEALTKAGDAAPTVLIAVGGSGRSQHFAAAAADKKKRKKLAKRLVQIFNELPFLSGVDLDWEAPTNVQQWRDLGKLAKEVRTALTEAGHANVLLTMGYRPGSGAVAAFSSLQGKSSGRAFVDLFDFCHAMAYTHFDNDRKHSTPQLDKAALEEWVGSSLPVHRLTLGIPFFGVNRRTGESVGYADILEKDPALASQPNAETTQESEVYFVGPAACAQKARYAARHGFGGVMVWELGQERHLKSGILAEIHRVLATPLSAMSWSEVIEAMVARSPISEDQVFMGLTAILGGYLLILVLVGRPRWDLRLPPRKPEEPREPQQNGEGDAAAASSEPTEDDKKAE